MSQDPHVTWLKQHSHVSMFNPLQIHQVTFSASILRSSCKAVCHSPCSSAAWRSVDRKVLMHPWIGYDCFFLDQSVGCLGVSAMAVGQKRHKRSMFRPPFRLTIHEKHWKTTTSWAESLSSMVKLWNAPCTTAKIQVQSTDQSALWKRNFQNANLDYQIQSWFTRYHAISISFPSRSFIPQGIFSQCTARHGNGSIEMDAVRFHHAPDN